MDATTTAEGDYLLRRMVQAAHDTGFTVSLALNVPGCTVSGRLVASSSWLAILATVLDVGSKVGPELAAEVRSSDESQPDYDYVHLENAHFVKAGGLMPPASSEGVLWRGRIDEVAGWSLGEFSTAE